MLPLENQREFFVQQRVELAELVGFETRNKYEILDGQKKTIGFAAEQGKGVGGFLFRQILGHWRTFEIHIFNNDRQVILKVTHPFRWIFQRLEIRDAQGNTLGALQQRFGLINKRFDVEDRTGHVVLEVRSPFWRIWTFPFFSRSDREAARVEKKWSGIAKELFTDTDNFRVIFKDPNLTQEIRNVIVCAALFIDLQYFERHANQKRSSSVFGSSHHNNNI
ncbi:MAG: phospholipid scramblase-related protein [Bacteriovoracaceae bacterium]